MLWGQMSFYGILECVWCWLLYGKTNFTYNLVFIFDIEFWYERRGYIGYRNLDPSLVAQCTIYITMQRVFDPNFTSRRYREIMFNTSKQRVILERIGSKFVRIWSPFKTDNIILIRSKEYCARSNKQFQHMVDKTL